ncbi:MAG: hypothetical protein IIA61_00110 [Candidatus Marinimicrobia bacterium]|nr:hypothetical protein [Candidatus Neomarinimicrobiota bacterium]
MRPSDLGCLVWLVCFALRAGFAQSVTKATHTFFLGEEKVWVDIYERAGADITLLNLHDNENTAVEAALAFIEKHGGRLIELRHGRGREIVVRLDGIMHRFDPNRMFSDVGLRASLEYFHNNTDEVFAIAAAFRDTIADLLGAKNGMVIIAVHNNTPYKMTINDFRPGEWYGEDTREVSINPQRDPDNFFVVTQDDLFAALSLSGHNVALRAQNPPDRGMLIDYCERLGVLYVTVEAEHGKLVEQEEMLETLWKILREQGKMITDD